MLEHLPELVGFLKRVKQNYEQYADYVIVTEPNILGFEYLLYALQKDPRKKI